MRCLGVEGHRYNAGPAVKADAAGAWLRGRINNGNQKEARRIWSLIRQPYTPIDWHLDFKSGYRWSEAKWHQDIVWGDQPGADVKVPWELARMQHLPQLVWAYALSASGQPGFPAADVYATEFRNQVLDFLATNPPHFGVNWNCTMDVAIRAANWLLAHDLFRAHGARFDDRFERIFHRGIVEHGRFIVSHLENKGPHPNNHYLSDLAGLLFVAAYLPPSGDSNAWLRFSVDELQSEIGRQFLPDGSNFEASTSYHRLGTEIALYSVAMLRGLSTAGRASIPHGQMETLAEWVDGMMEFATELVRPDGTVPQFADNDSGRFFKLMPAHDRLLVGDVKRRFTNLRHFTELPEHADYWYERPLDHRHLFDAAAGLCKTDPPTSAEAAVIRSLAQKPFGSVSVPRPVRYRSFTDIGLYIYKFDDFSLFFRCGPVGQEGTGGHAHNDQLSFEMAVGGRSLIVDPGTYLYSPDPNLRNAYRSTAMHNTLVLGGREQHGWEEGWRGLFSLRRVCRSQVISARPDEWIAEHDGFGKCHRRSVQLSPKGINVRDECGQLGERWAAFHLAPGVQVEQVNPSCVVLVQDRYRVILQSPTSGAQWHTEPYKYSPAYGWAEPALRLRLCHPGPLLDWQVNIEERS
jgi:Heparinase II/III-like protein/Heparinase II/III N-terminus